MPMVALDFMSTLSPTLSSIRTSAGDRRLPTMGGCRPWLIFSLGLSRIPFSGTLDVRRCQDDRVTRQVRTSPGVAYDLGYHVVWCPKNRRPVLGGRVKTRLEKLIRAKAGEHGEGDRGA
ncbi:transposase [Microbispora rosea]|uniref:transposase n=1 Tax=Microbispora rosea TaxID=58117 RepID=UPI00369918C9